MATRAVIDASPIEGTARAIELAGPSLEWARQPEIAARPRRLPLSIEHLRTLLHAQSRIESRIVMLHWVVMVLVAVGVILPGRLGPSLGFGHSVLALVVLMLHPLGYIGAATFFYNVLLGNQAGRASVFTAIDFTVAVGVLFLTASKPGYTQVLLFTVVLLAATRYNLSRAMGITTLLSVLQFFSIIASNASLQVTNVSSAVLAMFALTFGINQLSQAERKEAAIAAENARLYRAVLLRNRELATINALSQSVTQDTDPGRLFESGVELILSSIPVAWGQAFRYDRQSGELELLCVRQACRSGEEAGDAVREAWQAARTRSVVIGKSLTIGSEAMVRVAAPILVQGSSMGVLQAYVPLIHTDSSNELPTQSLTIVCQELGTCVEKALLRAAAQRSLVLEEKNRIAQELHDTVLQMLFSSNLGVDWCLQRTEDAVLTAKLSEVRKLTAQASSELRSAIFTLSSRVAEIGLLAALEQLTNSFIVQQDLPVQFSAIGQLPIGLSVLIQNALHRAARESLMNAYKHAHASHVAVRLICEEERLTLVIHDDGVGLPSHVTAHFGQDPTHFGLRTVARQIEELGGHFEVRNGEEGGVIVHAMVPAVAGPEGRYSDDNLAN